MQWRLVPTEEVGLVWASVAPILSRAVERDEGKRTLHTILRELVNGQNQLWLVEDEKIIGAVVTAVLTYPNARTLKIEWLAGERFDEWADLISVIESYARSNACNPVEFSGRPGLARKLKHLGYEIVAIEARKFIHA